jgi:hypothetical protein
MSELAAWSNFFIITGSAAGGLIGLQFVVLTLIAERPPVRAADGTAAYATPNIVHFSAVLLLSALFSVPWHSLAPFAILWGLGGLVGMAYVAVVARRMRSALAYKPGFEDWCSHAVLPFAAHATLALTSFFASQHTHASLFGVAAASLVLLFAGIHNAWDAVVYHVVANGPES